MRSISLMVLISNHSRMSVTKNVLTLLHSERPKLNGVLAILSAILLILKDNELSLSNL